MFDASAPQGNKHANRLTGVAIVGICLLAVLGCLAVNLVTWGRRLSARPVVLHVRDVALSAEITDNPSCAPLTDSCWVLPAGNRAKYLSIWVYIVTSHSAGMDISEWHVIALRLSRGGPPAAAGSPECWPSC